jgi:hypothetical protein
MNTDIGALTIIFTEFYYWLTVVLMFFIHIGFCMHEAGASRTKNMIHTLMKNTMVRLVRANWHEVCEGSPVTLANEQSLSLLQQPTRVHRPHGNDVHPLSTVAAAARRIS